MTEADLRYPVGKFQAPTSLAAQDRERLIAEIEQAPERLRAAVQGLSEAQLEEPYRPGGWRVRQVVHHVPDSHMNAFIRMRLALTQDNPVICAYDEDAWSRLPDSQGAPLDVSLSLLAGLHRRWVMMLRGMTEEQWARTYRHPESGLNTMDRVLALYAWHGRHHAAHITSLRERNGW